MTIKKKLIISTITLSTVLLILGLSVLLGYRHVANRASLANELDKESMYLQMMLRGVNEVIITEGTPASVEIAENGVNGFDAIHKKLMMDSETQGIHSIIRDSIDPQWQKIKEEVKPFLQKRQTSSSIDRLMVKYGRMITDTSQLIKNVNDLSEKARSVVNENSSKSAIVQYMIIAGIIVMLSVFMLLLRQIYRAIHMPVSELLSISEGFSKGDLSRRMNESTSDEFGVLAVHLNKAVVNLSSMISNVKAGADNLASNSSELSSSITHIASNTGEQSSQTAQAAAAAEELNTSFFDVARNSADAAESARKAAELAINGGSIVNKTVEGMSSIARSVKASAGVIESLGMNSSRISDMVNAISDIASQTNLLALNAAIEAARAGEQGRGFAVVADEVRKLAEKTTSATKEIVDTIQKIQADTDKAVKSMQAGSSEVEAGVALANQAGDSLQQIVVSVQNVTDMIQHIATAAEEQSNAGRDITSNLESVAELTRQTADSARYSSGATNDLNKLAHELKHSAAGFNVQNGAHIH